MNKTPVVHLSEIRHAATDIFHHKVSESISYHNLQHTQDVVAACEKMADFYQLNGEDRMVLLTAAWFHDTGFSSGKAEGHEDESIRLVTQFLTNHQEAPEFIEKIKSAIGATRMPQSPVNLLEEILCDADLFHLGTKDFRPKSKLLREELTNLSGEKFSKKQWRKRTAEFLEKHRYFTSYGREKLQWVQDENLQQLRGETTDEPKDKKEIHETVVDTNIIKELKDNVENKELKEAGNEKKRKEQQTDRGISTVFRIMASNHANLSHMADNKAHIMISVNSIILSVVISLLIRHLDEHQNLVIPTIILVTFCVAATIFAVLATRPNVSQGTFTKEDIHHKKTNLLFFGNFHSMHLDDYDWAMMEIMSYKDFFYGSIIKDI
ncbi:MAG: hypothetical protein JWM28_382 [Chitinophagaceae bacterium]|nr:hypothetical protein [Chitinophagaceae bacterium]